MDTFLPYFLFPTAVLSLALSFFWSWRCRRDVMAVGQDAGKGTFYILAAIFCLAVLARLFLSTPKHLLFNDEFYHMIAAKTLLQHGDFGDLVKSPGWSLLIAGAFALFGTHNYTAISATMFFGALTALVIFYLVFLVLRDRRIAFLSALVFALMPDHIFWSATAETNVVSIFFVSLCAAAMFLYFQYPSRRLLWLCLSVTAVAAHIRPENFIFFGLLAAGIRLFLKRSLDLRDPAWAVVLFLCLPRLVHAFRYHEQVITSPTGNFYQSLVVWFPRLVDASLYPWLFIVLFLIGFVYLWRRYAAYHAFVSLWFAALCLIYFYGWNDFTCGKSPFFTKTRFFICLYPALMIWFGAGVFFVLGLVKNTVRRKQLFRVIAACLLFSFFPYLKDLESKRELTGAQILETKVIGLIERDLAAPCAVVAAYPEILKATTRLTVLDMDRFIDDRDYRSYAMENYRDLYFFEDYACFVLKKESCILMKKMFRSTPIRTYGLEYKKRFFTYRVYRIVGPTDQV